MRLVRQEDASIGKLIQYWPLIVALFMGVAAYLKLSFTVDQYAAKADEREKKIDTQRESRTQEMEAIRMRLTHLEDINALSKLH